MAKQAKFVPKKKGASKFPWRLNIPASLSESGKRERRYFATKAEAQTEANIQQTRIKNFGVTSSGLNHLQQEAAATVFRLLGSEAPSKLVEIVQQHLGRTAKLEASVTIEELQTKFTKAKKKRSEKYLRQIRLAFGRLSPFASRKVPEIDSADIDRALKPLAESNRSLHLRVLRAAFNYAVKNKWLQENPVSSLDFAVERPGEVEVLTNLQVARLLAACRRFDPPLLPYHLLGLFAGIRPEELLRMRWEHIQLGENHIVLPKDVTKMGRRRVIEIEPTLATWLQWFITRYGTQHGPVTPPVNLRRRLRAIRKRAKFKEWLQDVMRHTYASNWLAKHEDIDRLLMRLGHYSPKVLWEHYHKAVLKKDAEEFWQLIPRTQS